jgi:AcrR family transcriptional regulator
VRRRAGVGKGTIYRYFHDKEDLYYHTILNGLDELIASMKRCASPSERKGGNALARLAEEVERFFSERRGLFALLRSEELRGSDRSCRFHRQWKGRHEAIVAIFADAIRRGIEERRYRPAAEPAVLASIFLGMLRASSRHGEHHGHGPQPVKDIVRIFENGIRRR